MNNLECKDCQYFLQHYILDKQKFYKIYCGHCTFSRAKRKCPDMPACEHFTAGSADTDAFASKEYLTKELLQYMLTLDLLPEIKDALTAFQD